MTSRVIGRDVRCRVGTTMIEVVVAAMLLVAVMTFVTTLAFRIDLVWRDTAHHRTAMNELSNQLEALTMLPADELTTAMAALQPSELATRTLAQPELTGKVTDDEFGRRVVLRLNWQRRHPGNPVELVAWLTPESNDAEQAEAAE